MHQILNTLYVMTAGAMLHLDHDTLKVKVEGDTKLQVPLHHGGGLLRRRRVAQRGLIHRCAGTAGRSFSSIPPAASVRGCRVR